MESLFGIKANTLVREDNQECYLIKKIENLNRYIGLPRPSKKYTEIKPELIIKRAKAVVGIRFKEKALTLEGEHLHKECHKLIEKLSPTGKGNTLYLGIPLNARRDDIRDAIEGIIEEHISKRPADVQHRFNA